MMRISFFVLLPTLFTQLVLLYAAPLSAETEEVYVGHVCSVESYTGDSTFGSNLRNLFSSLSSQKDLLLNGFYQFSSGREDYNKVKGHVLCRGDVNGSECRSCVDFSTADLLQRCPTQKGAIVWYDKCMLAYSNSSALTFPEDGVNLIKPDLPRVNESYRGSYLQARWSLLEYLAFRASSSSGNPSRKFAVGDVSFSDSDKIYGLAQCNPGLEVDICLGCLHVASQFFPLMQRGRVSLAGDCDLRISPEQFFESMDEAPWPTIIYSRGKEGYKNRYIIVITILAVFCVVLIASVSALLCLRRRKEKLQNETEMRSRESSPYDFRTVAIETDEWKQRPQRGYGAVRNVTPIMERPMLAAQSPGSRTLNNTLDETSLTWIQNTPINKPSPR